MPDAEPLESALSLAARNPARQPHESGAYRTARTTLLAHEYDLRRMRESVAAARRRLPPGPLIDAAYRFEGAAGETDLNGLFGAHDTLAVYVMMFAPQGGRVRPCPMCTTTVAAWDRVARSIGRNLAIAIVARRTDHAAMRAFADARGWTGLPLYADLDGRYVRDRGAIGEGDMDDPDFAVFTRRGGEIRLFWADEMALADPGQDPRGQLDQHPLWTILDLTPGGRPANWYPTLDD